MGSSQRRHILSKFPAIRQISECHLIQHLHGQLNKNLTLNDCLPQTNFLSTAECIDFPLNASIQKAYNIHCNSSSKVAPGRTARRVPTTPINYRRWGAPGFYLQLHWMCSKVKFHEANSLEEEPCTCDPASAENSAECSDDCSDTFAKFEEVHSRSYVEEGRTSLSIGTRFFEFARNIFPKHENRARRELAT